MARAKGTSTKPAAAKEEAVDKKEAVAKTVKEEAVKEEAVSKAVKEDSKGKAAEKEDTPKDSKAAKETKAEAAPKEEKPVAEEAKKATAKKAPAKKTTVKKKEVEKVEEVYIQFQALEITTKDVLDKAKKAYVAEGHRESSIKSIRLYIKPEESMAYYVINDKFAGGVPLQE